MNLLYISKHGYIKDGDGNVFSVGMMGQDYFEKYLEHFDSVTVIGYVRNATESNIKKTVGDPIHDTDRIKFKLAPCGNGIFGTSLSNRAIKRLVETYIKDADAIVCKSASGAAFATRYAKKYNKPYMVEVVGCPWDALWNHSFAGKLLAPFEFLQLRRVVKHAPFVTYVTEEFLQGRYPTKGKSVSVSDVQLEPVNDEILNKRLNYELPIPVKIGTAGALHVAYKGQQYVIQALAKLKSEGKTGFEYHLAGGGDDSRLKALAKQLNVTEQVIFDGSIPHDRMFEWFDGIDIYIQPSTVEGLPRAVVEAMSRGLPALGARTGGIPELLGEKYIFSRKNVDEIARMLSEIDSAEMKTMAGNNFEHAKEFQKELLEKKRYDFYAAFSKAAGENLK